MGGRCWDTRGGATGKIKEKGEERLGRAAEHLALQERGGEAKGRERPEACRAQKAPGGQAAWGAGGFRGAGGTMGAGRGEGGKES